MSSHRYTSHSLACLALCFLVCCIASAQVELTPSHEVQHALAFISSPDAAGSVDCNQLRQCFSLLTQRLKLPQQALPHIVVIHASNQVAHAADVHASCVRRNAARDSKYYELWIVGPPKPSEYVRLFDTILEQHYNLRLSEEEKRAAGLFVQRLMSNTISAKGGSR